MSRKETIRQIPNEDAVLLSRLIAKCLVTEVLEIALQYIEKIGEQMSEELRDYIESGLVDVLIKFEEDFPELAYEALGESFNNFDFRELESLTSTQRETLKYIINFIYENRNAPSYREIMENFGLKSTASAHERVKKLEEKGWIYKEEGVKRAIRVSPQALNKLNRVF